MCLSVWNDQVANGELCFFTDALNTHFFSVFTYVSVVSNMAAIDRRKVKIVLTRVSNDV